jgi:hypothetical protein
MSDLKFSQPLLVLGYRLSLNTISFLMQIIFCAQCFFIAKKVQQSNNKISLILLELKFGRNLALG